MPVIDTARPLSPAGTLPAGKLLFVDTNRGSIPHELVMFKTDASKALPLRKNKELDEESPSIEAVIDSFVVGPGIDHQVVTSLEHGLKLGDGQLVAPP